MPTTWDESMETGDPHMDQQHREIIDLVDRLEALDLEAPHTSTRAFEMVEAVMDLTTRHFVTEEQLMDSIRYPSGAREEMLAQHQDFTAYARIRVMEVRAGDHTALAQLPEFLRTWLVEHEFGLDRDLVGWIRGRDGGDDRSES